MYQHDGLIDSNENVARSEFLRITAFEHLFSILDGNDTDAAIVRAGEWLRSLYGDTYDTNSRVMRGVRRLADERDEFPAEIDA